MESPPTGTVTFLFTDIEGSTRRWQDEPDAMRALLVEHDAILRDVIDKRHGHLFKHTGDGVAAVFASAADAVNSAVDAQARLQDVLPVRMGLHTGEAELRDGDYFGSTLNRCARLMGVAHGGQIVCGTVTAELVRDRGDLRDLGEHRLRDLSRAERVFQVGGAEFAALRSLDVASTNLPLQLSSFVGREAELAEIAAGVRDARLVTLTGVGGVGKTRLALQVAGEVLPRFADGVWLCELAAAANGDDMAQVVALALGVMQRQQMTLAESIVDFLRTRETLVVLDNCEHLLDATTALVDGILAGAPKVRILATSREGFGIPGERVRPLRSLSVAGDDPASSDAVVLFVERAETVASGFALNAQSTPAVVELCRRLDGIPLAIELAAARVATMSPADIVAHLDERFRLLTGGKRGRVERHQTLRAAIEWSYSLLDDTERMVFDRLGVFPSSFDEAAAVAVCATDGIERWDVIDALAGLVAKSMVGSEPTGETIRYQLLETLRHFARDHAGDLDGLRRRHAAHYATVAEDIVAGLSSRDEFVWRPRFAVELDNLRAAVGWAFDAADPEDFAVGVRVIEALFYEAMSQPSWGILAWATPALGRVADLEAGQRAIVHAAVSCDAFYRGDIDRAGVLGRMAIAESVAFTPAYYVALCMATTADLAHADPAAAMAALADGRVHLGADGSPDRWTCLLGALAASIDNFVGDHDTARAEAQDSVAIARRLGAPSLLAASLAVHGHILCNDDPRQALAVLDEAIELFEAGLSGELMYSASLMTTAVLRAESGDLVGAARTLRTVVENAARNGNRPNVTGGVVLAIVALSGHPDRLVVAATLQGAHDGPMLAEMPMLRGGTHQARYDRAVARVTTGLAPDDHARAHERGAAMTYDEIVTYTLDQLTRLAQQ